MKGGAYARRDWIGERFPVSAWQASMKGGAYARRDAADNLWQALQSNRLDEGRRVRAPRSGAAGEAGVVAGRASMKGGAYARRDSNSCYRFVPVVVPR